MNGPGRRGCRCGRRSRSPRRPSPAIVPGCSAAKRFPRPGRARNGSPSSMFCTVTKYVQGICSLTTSGIARLAVLRVAVVEGDADGRAVVDAAAHPPLRLGQRNQLEVPLQPADLPDEGAVGHRPRRGAVVGDAVIKEHADRHAPPGRGATADSTIAAAAKPGSRRPSSSIFQAFISRLLIQCLTLRPASQRWCRRRAKGRRRRREGQRIGRGAARKWALYGSSPRRKSQAPKSPARSPAAAWPRDQPPRLLVQPADRSRLISVNTAVAGELIFGGDRPAVQLQPVEPELALREQSPA